MSSPLHAIQSVDVQIYYWLSQFHGSGFCDRLASRIESNTLFKSGLLIAMYWYFWFIDDREQQQRRAKILTILSGTMVGLIATRVVATLAPFRVRPLYDLSLHHTALSIPTPTDFMNWSSFPSDHAAYLCALGFGLIWLSRRLAVPISLYLAAWICMPRLYLGIHYTSDVLAGAAMGIFFVWAALQFRWVTANVSRPMLAFADAKPQIFYPVAFLGMFEMATLFWDIRGPVQIALRAVTHGPHHRAVEAAVLFLVCVIASIAFYLHDSAPAQHAPSHSMLAKSARFGRI